MADETQEVGGRDDLHNALHQRLVETGEWDRLQTLLRRMLQDCGWEAELAQTAREKAKAQRELHLGSLVAELAPHARANLPTHVRAQITAVLRDFLDRNVEDA